MKTIFLPKLIPSDSLIQILFSIMVIYLKNWFTKTICELLVMYVCCRSQRNAFYTTASLANIDSKKTGELRGTLMMYAIFSLFKFFLWNTHTQTSRQT